ncbi:hypothetical protein AQS8620_01868 [Aquimixticola soesokkakensis]|uniref:Uncharacterized protein n=1 Tax=Aquimixticola soesokkakensis TaxID=1519096 RepID=A0A1Y5SQ06_9RHOB|nr:hypothetical protein AQS8620_01868 [Aquimixticola soesokkakensis]
MRPHLSHCARAEGTGRARAQRHKRLMSTVPQGILYVGSGL